MKATRRMCANLWLFKKSFQFPLRLCGPPTAELISIYYFPYCETLAAFGKWAQWLAMFTQCPGCMLELTPIVKSQRVNGDSENDQLNFPEHPNMNDWHKKTAAAFVISSFVGFAPYVHASEQKPAVADDAWHGSIGLGGISTPRYPGADSQRALVVPVISATKGRFLLGAVDTVPTVPFGIGWRLYRVENFQVVVAGSYDLYSLRKESLDPRLAGLGDIEKTARAALAVRYTVDRYSAFGTVTSDVGGKHQGSQLRIGADARFSPFAKTIITIGPSATWGTSQANQTMFGINDSQHLNSGRPQFSPGSGLTEVGLSVGAIYTISSSWSLAARASVSRLSDKVSESPIVASQNQFSGALLASYSF